MVCTTEASYTPLPVDAAPVAEAVADAPAEEADPEEEPQAESTRADVAAIAASTLVRRAPPMEPPREPLLLERGDVMGPPWAAELISGWRPPVVALWAAAAGDHDLPSDR
jgi:hypothetical protein